MATDIDTNTWKMDWEKNKVTLNLYKFFSKSIIEM